MKKQLIAIAILVSVFSIQPLGAQTPVKVKTEKMRLMTRGVLLDKIKGGWAAKMVGVAYGAPTEFKALGKIYDAPIGWKQDQAAGSIHQDDLYVQMTFAAVLDNIGLDATCEQFGEAFKVSKYPLWHANAGARRNLNRNIKAPWSGHPKYNAHADDIDFQIEADFIGLMCPGLPQVANNYCDRVGHVMNYGDGVYGGMWLCGMYSAAFFENDPRKLVEAGLQCIPARSKYAQIIRDVLTWHKEDPENWTNCWNKIQAKWDKNDLCPDGALEPFNIDAKLNGAYIALGMLYGNGDLSKTMEIATRAGQDSDCNPGNAAGVLGVVMGYNKIPENWKAGIPSVMDTKFLHTEYTLNDVIKATEKHALALVERAGGKVSDKEIAIPVQKVRPWKMEQWFAGVPDKMIPLTDVAWTWKGDWENTKNGKCSSSPQSEATLKFNGVTVMLTGLLNQSGGRADVYIDGEKSAHSLDAYVGPDIHDRALWHIYGLTPGDHALRIVPRGSADSRSKGKAVTISQALVYRAK